MTTKHGQSMIKIPLGPLDHIAPSNIPQSIIYLSLKPGVSPKSAFSCLYGGLCQVMLQAPWLAGRIYRQSEETPGWRPGQLEIRYEADEEPSALLRMKELDTTLSFTDLRNSGFELDVFDDEDLLWTSPFDTNFDSGVAVFAAQASFIPGGCLLVLSIAPAASDGTAMLNVTKMWADHCSNGMTQGNGSGVRKLQLAVDRSALDAVWADSAGTDKHVAFPDLVGLDSPDELVYPTNGHLEETAAVPRKPSIFYMPQTAYSALRKQCVAEAGRTDVSGNDLICAVIWRNIIRAWVATKNSTSSVQVATLAIPFDARPELASALQTSFLGNMNFENKVTLPLERLLANSTTIPWVARHIRAHAAARTEIAALQSAYDLLNNLPEYGLRHTQLRASQMLPETASVGILSPMVLPFNDTCFGKEFFGNDGKPESFRPLMGKCSRGYRTCFVIPRKQYGGIEFVMMLSEQEMEFLRGDEEFSGYAFPLS